MKCTDVYDHNRWHFSKGTDSRKNVGVRKNDLSKIGTKLISSRTLLIVIEIRKESINKNFRAISLFFFLSTKYMFSKKLHCF